MKIRKLANTILVRMWDNRNSYVANENMPSPDSPSPVACLREVFTYFYRVVKVEYCRNTCENDELGGILSVHNWENEYVKCTKFKL